MYTDEETERQYIVYQKSKHRYFLFSFLHFASPGGSSSLARDMTFGQRVVVVRGVRRGSQSCLAGVSIASVDKKSHLFLAVSEKYRAQFMTRFELIRIESNRIELLLLTYSLTAE